MFNRYLKYTPILLIVLLFSACTTSTRITTVKDEKTGKIKEIPIFEEIEVKLINDYKEIYNIEDVLIGYKTNGFNPFESKIISDKFKSSDEKFNSIYSSFSKNGLEEDVFKNKFMTFTDDSILGILAKEYGMKVIVVTKNDNKTEILDYKNRDIHFSKREKYYLYNAFEKTIAHYQEQLDAK